MSDSAEQEQTRHDRADGDEGTPDVGELLEEIPWDEEEDAITARVFEELNKQWEREERRKQRQSKHPSTPPPEPRDTTR